MVINAIDHHWQEHLTEMEELRRSIGLRSYGQKDPLRRVQGRGLPLFRGADEQRAPADLHRTVPFSATNLQAFENMLAILARSARLQGPESAPANGTALRPRATPAPPPPPATLRGSMGTMAAPVPDPEAPAAESEVQLPRVTVRREAPKVGRNDPCPCGSGKKYKHCHGK